MSAVLPASRTDELAALVRSFSGLDVTGARAAALERAVGVLVARTGVPGTRALGRRLRDPAHRHELEELCASLTVGETYFFRNRPQIDALRDHVLPELVAARAHERRLRIWSAGCATGEEAYTVAMLVDLVLPDRRDWDITILATDINRDALDGARAAAYAPWSFRQAPADLVGRYFTVRGQRRVVRDDIRAMVSFAHMNLADDGTPAQSIAAAAMDLILCRNVLIYFDPSTAERVVARLASRLRPGGWLVTGHAETPLPAFRAHLEPREYPMAVLFHRPGDDAGTAPTASQASGPAPDPAPRAARDTDDLDDLHRRADADPADPAPLHEAARLLARQVRLEEAERTARLALDRAPDAWRTHHLHALILRELGRHDEALSALRRCVYLAPAFALGQYGLGAALAAGGRKERAEICFAAAVMALAGHHADAPVEEGDGLTAGRLRDLIETQRRLART